MEPTIDSPYDSLVGEHYLQVTPIQLWLIDGQTGVVERKFSQESLAKDKDDEFKLKLKQHPLIVELSTTSLAILDITVDDEQQRRNEVLTSSDPPVVNASQRVILTWRMPRDFESLKIVVNGRPFSPNWQKKEIVAGTYRSVDEATVVVTVPR